MFVFPIQPLPEYRRQMEEWLNVANKEEIMEFIEWVRGFWIVMYPGPYPTDEEILMYICQNHDFIKELP